MKKQYFKNSKVIYTLIILLAVITLIVTIFTLKNAHGLTSAIEDSTLQYLDDLSSQAEDLIDRKVKGTFNSMTGWAEHIADMSDDKEIQKFLERHASEINFIELAVMDLKGNVLMSNADGKNFFDIDAVQSARVGANSICHYQPTEGLFYAVPIYKGHHLSGVLGGYTTENEASALMHASSFNKQSSFCIVDLTGHVITSPREDYFFKEIYKIHENNSSELHEIFEFMEDGFRYRMDGVIPLTTEDGIDFWTHYSYLRDQNWYLLTFIPQSFFSEDLGSFMEDNVLISIFTIVFFSIILLAILFVQNSYQRRLERTAYVDPVTDGINIARFQDLTKDLIFSHPEDTYALISMNLRGFRYLNDMYDTDRGNDVLRHIYNIVLQNIDHDRELVTRENADCYYLLLLNTSEQELQKRLDFIVERINDFNTTMDTPFILKFSFGAYTIDDLDDDIFTMQARATSARKRYIADSSRSFFFTNEDRENQIREHELLDMMPLSLENRDFKVYLQPKVDTVTRRICGAEALIRWIHPTRGFLPPDSFIPLFEKHHLIQQLDLFVFSEVCALLQKWEDEGRELIPISCNLSRLHLLNPDFLDDFRDIYNRYSFPANMLELEMTESTMIENPEKVISTIDAIHSIGFTCSLDDFGSGYSALGLLKTLNVDVLKIDRSFFDINTTERGMTIINGIFQLAQNLNVRTVAEGIEMLPQVDTLQNIGCDMIQGYVFSRPLPITDFEAFAFDAEKIRILK